MGKIIACFLAGFVVACLVRKIPWFRLMWDTPQTPEGWRPRYRYWKNGVELK